LQVLTQPRPQTVIKRYSLDIWDYFVVEPEYAVEKTCVKLNTPDIVQ